LVGVVIVVIVIAVVLAAVATLAAAKTYAMCLANLFLYACLYCGRRVKGTSNNV
jgi:hypothetical protein